MPDASSSPWTDLGRPPLRAGPLRRALVDGPGPWTSVEVLPRTGSTNDDLAARAAAGDAGDGAVLTTDDQRAGRGRHDRTWSTPPRSSVAVSVLLVPAEVPQARWSWLPLLAGVAVVEALADVAGVDAGLKWPNDVLVGVDGEDRKVCGVLAQVVATPAGAGVVVGLGVNVTQRADELPSGSAASLATAAATTTDRDTVLRAALRSLGRWTTTWRAAAGDPGSSGLAAAYRAASTTVGSRVRVHLPADQLLVGVATGLDDDGRLLVAPADGSPARALAAGDVVHLR